MADIMEVAYDVTSLAQSPYGGVAQVCFHTLIQASRHPGVSPMGYYRRGRRENIVVDGVPPHRLSFTSQFRRTPFDIVHALCHRLPLLRAQKVVYTLYDAWSLQPNKYQSPNFQKKIGQRMRKELRKADVIVTISEWTRSQLLKLELADANKCVAVRLGVALPGPPPQASGKTDIDRWLTEPYVLFVGRIEARKNIGHLVEAVMQLSQLSLVIVGEPGFGYEDIVDRHLARFPSDRLCVLNRLAAYELDLLYRNAVAMLLPSWEEGFGLPILEAMVRGCPVITSNCSAASEIGAGGAILVDPADPTESHNALTMLYEDAAYRSRWRQIGLAHSSNFGWSKYFEDMISVYRSILSN
jgi:glycosyltransferase involved in cell wall biosynthesis